MAYVVGIVVVLVVLFGVEALFRLRRRGRRILVGGYLAWVLLDGIWSARANPGGATVAFAVSVLDSLVPLGIWYLLSWKRWLRERVASVESGKEV